MTVIHQLNLHAVQMVLLLKYNSMLVTSLVDLNQEQAIENALILHLSCVVYYTLLYTIDKTNTKQLTGLMHFRETSTLFFTSFSSLHSPFVDMNQEQVIKQVSTDNLPFFSFGEWFFKMQNTKQHTNLRHQRDITESNFLNEIDTSIITDHSATQLHICHFKLKTTTEKVTLPIIRTQQLNPYIKLPQSFNHSSSNTTSTYISLVNNRREYKPMYYKNHR